MNHICATLLVLCSAFSQPSTINLEIKTGMKVSRGRTAYSIIKNEFNLKGNKQNILNQFTKLVEERL